MKSKWILAALLGLCAVIAGCAASPARAADIDVLRIHAGADVWTYTGTLTAMEPPVIGAEYAELWFTQNPEVPLNHSTPSPTMAFAAWGLLWHLHVTTDTLDVIDYVCTGTFPRWVDGIEFSFDDLRACTPELTLFELQPIWPIKT